MGTGKRCRFRAQQQGTGGFEDEHRGSDEDDDVVKAESAGKMLTGSGKRACG